MYIHLSTEKIINANTRNINTKSKKKCKIDKQPNKYDWYNIIQLFGVGKIIFFHKNVKQHNIFLHW